MERCIAADKVVKKLVIFWTSAKYSTYSIFAWMDVEYKYTHACSFVRDVGVGSFRCLKILELVLCVIERCWWRALAAKFWYVFRSSSLPTLIYSVHTRWLEIYPTSIELFLFSAFLFLFLFNFKAKLLWVELTRDYLWFVAILNRQFTTEVESLHLNTPISFTTRVAVFFHSQN